jgi:multidrug efflux pump subunit AcrA (membrane-fusion protein)
LSIIGVARSGKIKYNIITVYQYMEVKLMRLGGKAFVKKAAIIFLGAMVFFTFASRSIHYFMTPKVVAEPVESGYIRINYMVESVDLYSENSVAVTVPVRADTSVGVAKAHIEPGSMVSAGDSIVTFEAASFNNVFEAAKQEYENKRIEFLELERAYEDKKKNLQRDIENWEYEIKKIEAALSDNCKNTDDLKRLEKEAADMKERLDNTKAEHEALKLQYEGGLVSRQDYEKSLSNIQKLEKDLENKRNEYGQAQKKLVEEYTLDKKDYEFRLKGLQEQLDYINTTGIINGKPLEAVRTALEELEDRLTALEAIKNNGYTVAAPREGIAGKIYIDGGFYKGPDAILNIIPGNDEVMYALRIEEKHMDSIDSNAYCTIIAEKTEIPVEKVGITSINGKMHLLFRQRADMRQDYISLLTSNPRLEKRGGYCDAIIPNSALVESNKVYVLEKRQGFWGEEYYAQKKEVVTGQSNENKTEIINGLSRNDTVITGWDRALSDGARVMLPIN